MVAIVITRSICSGIECRHQKFESHPKRKSKLAGIFFSRPGWGKSKPHSQCHTFPLILYQWPSYFSNLYYLVVMLVTISHFPQKLRNFITKQTPKTNSNQISLQMLSFSKGIITLYPPVVYL